MNVTSRPGSMPLPSMNPLPSNRSGACRGTTAAGLDGLAAAAAASTSTASASTGRTAVAGAPSLAAAFPMPLSTAQFAQRAAAAPPSLASLDGDGDGSVSASEYGLQGAGALGQQLFLAVDSDGNGSLGSDEIGSFEAELSPPAGPAAASDPVIAALDGDGDGAISSSEFGLDGALDGDSVQDLFELIDRDGGGSLSGGEMARFRDEVQQALDTSGGALSAAPGGDLTVTSSTSMSDQDLQGFLQQLANQYADLAAGLGDAAASLVDLRA